MKVIAFLGSPREGGNSDLLLRESCSGPLRNQGLMSAFSR